jgi:hypothetical protein
LTKVWQLLYSNESVGLKESQFYKFLATGRNCRGLLDPVLTLGIDISAWKNPPSSDPLGAETCTGNTMKSSTRSINYVAALTNPLGPKSTRCIGEEILVNAGSSYFCVSSSSETPDVPSGNCFKTYTLVCVSIDELDAAKVEVWWKVEWRRSSWLRIPIEMGVDGGLKEYWKVLDSAIQGWGDGVVVEGVVEIGDDDKVGSPDKICEDVIYSGIREVTDKDVDWLIKVVRKGVELHWRQVVMVGLAAFSIQVLMVWCLVYSMA